MDKLIKSRSSIRRLITMTIKDLDADFVAKDVVNLRTKSNKLATYEEQIAGVDKNILEIMLRDEIVTDEQYQNEVIGIDSYVEKIVKARIQIEMVLDGLARVDKSVDEDLQSVQSVNKKRYKLRKIELTKFSGKILDWLNWWALFEKIDEDDDLSDADKFHYLLQSIEEKGRAYDCVKAFPASATAVCT